MTFMAIKKLVRLICLIMLLSTIPLCYAEEDGLGQVIRIRTQLHSFVGKPSWLIMIRDVDHNENIPYLFDFTRGDNFWVIPTFGRNYLISASTLKINTYQSHYNTYRNDTISNFCNLESFGRIIRDESIYIMLSGDLSPFNHSYDCQISRYRDTNFIMTNSGEEE